MPPQNTEADAMQVESLVGGANDKNSTTSGLDEEKGGAGGEVDGSGVGRGGRGGGEELASEASIEGIPLKRWVMHGAVMFGREFCYAMETALVTPVLLQIGECPRTQIMQLHLHKNIKALQFLKKTCTDYSRDLKNCLMLIRTGCNILN